MHLPRLSHFEGDEVPPGCQHLALEPLVAPDPYPDVVAARDFGEVNGAGKFRPSITTTLPQFGQFLAEHRFAEGNATKLPSAWVGPHEEVLKVPILGTVVVILGVEGYPEAQNWKDTPRCNFFGKPICC